MSLRFSFFPLFSGLAATQGSLAQGEPEHEGLGQLVAQGGGWLVPGELKAQMRRAPPWGCLHRVLLPACVTAVFVDFVAAYFGVPTALLSLWAVALGVGHVAPGLRAREMSGYWTPREHHVRFCVGTEGIVVESVGGLRRLPLSEVSKMYALPEGWLIWFRRRPPLWLPRSFLGDAQAGRVERMFVSFVTRPPCRRIWAMYVGVSVMALAGTAAWYRA